MRYHYKLIIVLGLTLSAITMQVVSIGCSTAPKQTIQTSLDLAAYSLALDDCRAIGKDAGSYAVYESCAQKADVKYGRKDGGL